jgi:hypothetical protein
VKTSLAAIASAILFTCAPAFSLAAPVASADPAVVSATRQMLEAMKIRESMAAMIRTMEQQMPAQMRASAAAAINGNTSMTPAQKAEQLKKLDEAVALNSAQMHTVFADPTLVDEMIAETVTLYAETYTLDEIRQLTAFYTSPVGQKMQANMPTLMARSFAISQRVLMPRMQKAMAASAQAAPGK